MDVEILFVGDFFQHTFDTSRDGNIQKKLHDNYEAYLTKLKDSGYTIDLDTLSHSYRCSPTVCRFVNEKIGITISSHRRDEVNITLVEDAEHINRLLESAKSLDFQDIPEKFQEGSLLVLKEVYAGITSKSLQCFGRSGRKDAFQNRSGNSALRRGHPSG